MAHHHVREERERCARTLTRSHERGGKARVVVRAGDDQATLHPGEPARQAVQRRVVQRPPAGDHRHERIHLEGGTTLTGPQVASHLGGAQRVVAAVCTIGPQL